MSQHPRPHWIAWFATPIVLAGLLVAGLLLWGSPAAAAPDKPPAKPTAAPRAAQPFADQIIPGFPLSMTVEDLTNVQIRYRDYGDQFYGRDAEGVYLWVNSGGTTKVYGPGQVPAGRATNPYTVVSNHLAGNGSPSTPWTVTTVVEVPSPHLRLTQHTSYVNGAEFVSLAFTLEQIGGSTPVTATLFHAGDLYTAGNDSGYGFYDSTTGGIGDYFTPTTGSLAGTTLYQQFVPNSQFPAPSAHQESYYSTIWGNIGSTSGPGPGFDNTIITTIHNSGAGLEWRNLTVPVSGNVTVGDTDLFSPHASLCGSFSDVPYGSFYYDYIYYLACHNIVSGYSDTTFRPGAGTTRGQLSKIAANSAGFTETVSGQIFTDVPSTNPFYPYIQRMATRSLISGYNCGTRPDEPCDTQHRPYFRWGDPVTRGQLAKIIANAKGLSGTPTGQTFTDVPSSSPFYVYVERLAALGTISGYTCGTRPDEPCDTQHRPYFRLGNGATRGQISKIDKLTFFP